MRKWIGRMFAAIGALVVLCVMLFVGLGIYAARSTPKIPSSVVLELDLEAGITEVSSDDPIAKWMGNNKQSLQDIRTALRRGGQDPRVKGLVIRLGNTTLGFAHIQELRDAILSFRQQKKWAIAFSETFGEFGTGNGPYYLATACDEIYVQPSGDVGLTGLALETMFFRGTLDKLGIVPQLDHRKDYKTAMNQFTEKKMTPAHKESMESLAKSLFGQFVRGLAEGRKLPEDKVRALINEGPFSATDALAAHLIDGVRYRDEVYSDLKSRSGANTEMLYLSNYIERLPAEPTAKHTFALIYGLGNVSRGKSTPNPLSGTYTMGSDTLVSAFESAARDKNIKAIVFRIDSPGGSYVASDSIWHAVTKARAQGKHVIVSMGNVAGSGGYFVAMPADRIVAEPATLTGSIGVFAGKAVLDKLLSQHLGISIDEVHEGKNALMWSNTQGYSDAEWKKVQSFLDTAYADFVKKAATGRNVPEANIEKSAQGRVWTGEQAKELGLVDALGGLDTAIQLAKQSCQLPETDTVHLQVFPKPKNAVEQIVERIRGNAPSNSEQEISQRIAADTIRTLQPFVRQAQKWGLTATGQDTILTMPITIEATP